MKPEDIARVCHEANRAVTAIIEDVPVQKGWQEIDSDMRASCIKGVEFALANPDASPEAQHEAWCDERKAQGWVYGERKDVEAKTYPALKPYADLADGVRKKDALFRAVVGALK